MTDQRPGGFQDHMSYLPVPLQVLHRAVSSVDDLVELKVILTVLRGLARKRAGARWVTARELLLDPALTQALGQAPPEARAQVVGAAAQRTCQRGIFVCGRNGQDDVAYALNAQADRRALEAAGWSIAQEEVNWPTQEVAAPRSTIFALYEQNVGLVTPLLAEELQEAEATYPAEWIEEAFREAVAYNKRNWRYIRRILENWATQGRDEHGASWGRTEAAGNRRRNLGGRFRPVAGRD